MALTRAPKRLPPAPPPPLTWRRLTRRACRSKRQQIQLRLHPWQAMRPLLPSSPLPWIPQWWLWLLCSSSRTPRLLLRCTSTSSSIMRQQQQRNSSSCSSNSSSSSKVLGHQLPMPHVVRRLALSGRTCLMWFQGKKQEQ